MPVNPEAPPDPAPQRALASVRGTAKTHIEAVLLGIGFLLGAAVVLVAR